MCRLLLAAAIVMLAVRPLTSASAPRRTGKVLYWPSTCRSLLSRLADVVVSLII